ncbi:hypothetical protein [Kitasatospora sp. MMS16-BH015]|uniref:hypothetical protein n=1 Tax=Kitasatospora sp. MMS16-BH015 TaxID=2018025 RepID=UPI00131A4C82|nr:hypothetical protein [Kitasatospora sp. MMS16-BH015]
MAETERDRPMTRAARLFTGGALRRHPLLLALVGAACVGIGIMTAVAVPDSDGPAWAMAVAGCLAAGVMLLGRVAFARLRPPLRQ